MVSSDSEDTQPPDNQMAYLVEFQAQIQALATVVTTLSTELASTKPKNELLEARMTDHRSDSIHAEKLNRFQEYQGLLDPETQLNNMDSNSIIKYSAKEWCQVRKWSKGSDEP